MHRLLVIVFVLVMIFVTPASAQWIGLFSDVNCTNEYFDNFAPGLVTVYVAIYSPIPLNAVQFRAPVPYCWEGATWLADNVPYLHIAGNSQTGITVGFGECLSEPIYVMSILVYASNPPPVNTCCFYEVLPYSGGMPDQVEFFDCSDALVYGYGRPGIIGEGNVPAWVNNPSPPDSAHSVSLDAHLSWESWACCATADFYNVWFGTSPDPPLVTPTGHDTKTYDPGPLQPNTTYYWRISMWWGFCAYGQAVSPVWRFTTESPIPVEDTSWGKIKALYR